ncbi:MAG: hypothetical protein JWO91_1670 [Acidobacteriaceae bacterium]|nr:hypothetical protein [Acidobacteriaceae bacterium]
MQECLAAEVDFNDYTLPEEYEEILLGARKYRKWLNVIRVSRLESINKAAAEVAG